MGSEAPGTMELHNVGDYVDAFSSGIWTLLYLTLNPFTVFVFCDSRARKLLLLLA